MEGLAAAVVLIAVLLGVLLVVAFDLFCLVHLMARDNRVRFLPKLAWAVAIVCISPFGGLVYLLSAARLTPYAPRLGDGSLRRPRLPAREPSAFAVLSVKLACPASLERGFDQSW
jgi:predicted lysophospholipase L1 biosynthesis ABC-type transport system permease subunit